MKFTSPTEFNDPFDCVPEIDVAEYVRHASSRKDLLKKSGDRLGYSPAKRIENKNKMLRRVEKNVSDDNFIKNISRNVGICSLTRDPLNLLMWAHYAKDHTGFVVEFRIPTEATKEVVRTESKVAEFMLNCLFPLEVTYSDKKPVLDSFDDIDANAKKQFLIKGIDWEYEKEERVIDHHRGPGIHKFDRNKIVKSVIAGMRMKDDDYGTLKSSVDAVNEANNINIRLYRARPEQGKYSLYVPDRDDLCVLE